MLRDKLSSLSSSVKEILSDLSPSNISSSPDHIKNLRETLSYNKMLLIDLEAEQLPFIEMVVLAQVALGKYDPACVTGSQSDVYAEICKLVDEECQED